MDWARALSGGSGTSVEHRGPYAVKARPGGEPARKIDDERRWLRWMHATAPPATSRWFVPVVERGRPVPGRLVMPWVDGPTARQAALEGSLDVEQAEQAVRAVACGLFALERSRAVVDGWWSRQLHTRLAGAATTRPALRHLSDRRFLRLDGGRIPNPLWPGPQRMLGALAALRLVRVGVIHGDLHLGNLLLRPGQPCWIDPRGRFGSGRTFDLAYDVAKLLHEPHYVAVRGDAVATSLRTTTDGLRAKSRLEATESDRAACRRLATVSLHLAESVCRAVGADDPLLAARASLYTGLLFITVLPFTTREWEAMLLWGLLWLSCGLDAVERAAGFRRCRSMWSELTGGIDHHAGRRASPELLAALAPG